MNEEKFKGLVQNSIIKTSDDFTEKVMQKVEAEQVFNKEMLKIRRQILHAAVLSILIGGITIAALLLLGYMPAVSLINISIDKIPFMAFSLLVIMLGVNSILHKQVYLKRPSY